MATEYQVENRTLYVRLDGELDHHLAERVRHKCDVILKSYPIRDIEFDFKNTGFMDSSGVGMILGLYKQLKPLGGTVSVVNVNDVVKRIVHMAGLHKIINER